QESADLTAFLAREFDDVAGTVGQEAEVVIKVREGVKPLRSLGREAKIEADRIVYRVGALFGGVEQVLLAEVEVAPSSAGTDRQIADVHIAYNEAASGRRITAEAATAVRFTSEKAASEASINATVDRDVTALLSREARAEAVRLRDAGRIEEARSKFKANAEYVREKQRALPGAAAYAPLVDELKASESAASDAAQTSEGWAKTRKTQRAIDSNQFGASTKF
ncbi:MAG: hypothetical protein AB7F78_17645, partial [Hyphomicrobiaceae bacterium]